MMLPSWPWSSTFKITNYPSLWCFTGGINVGTKTCLTIFPCGFLLPRLLGRCFLASLRPGSRPTTTSTLIFVPCTLSDSWWRFSHHLVEIDEIRLDKIAFNAPCLPILIAVLYLTPHIHSLPVSRGLVIFPMPRGYLRHQCEVGKMCRTHETLLMQK